MINCRNHGRNSVKKMIKLKSLLTEATIACGECLSYAWKTYIINQDNKRANKKMKIVFGSSSERMDK